MPLALVVSVPSILLLFLLVAVSPSEVAQEILQVGTASSSSVTENSLTELTIIGTADGVLHAVDSEKDDGSGMLIWSLDTGQLLHIITCYFRWNHNIVIINCCRWSNHVEPPCG